MSGTTTLARPTSLRAEVVLLRQHPLNCAAGEWDKAAHIRLNKSKTGATLKNELLKEFPKMSPAPRFGTAVVPEGLPDEVHLDLNAKLPRGVCKRLARQFKGTGVRKVKLLVGGEMVEAAGSEDDEQDDEQDGEGAAQGSAQGSPQGPVEAQAAAPSPPKTLDRILAAGKAIRGLATGDERGAEARRLFSIVGEAFKANPGAVPAELAQLEALAAAPAATGAAPATPPAAAAPPTAAANPRAAFTKALQNAYGDFESARSIPHARRAELEGLIAEMKGAARGEAFDHALELSRSAQALAVGMAGEARAADRQAAAFGRLKPVLDKVRKTYFTEASIEAAKKLHPGRTFKALIDAQEGFRGDPTAERCDAVAAAADEYLRHFDKDLMSWQRKTKEHQAKKANAEAAQTGARHMKLAVQMEAFGPPPWSAETAAKVGALQAAFAFEANALVNLGTGQPVTSKAKPLAGDGGVTAAFWVDSYDPSVRRRDEDKPAASDRVFLFKPSEGESDVSFYPAGGSAPREAITHAASEALRRMTGLDLDCPETHLATVRAESIDVVAYNAGREPGAQAPELDAGRREFTGSLQQFAASRGKLQDHLETVDPAAFSVEDCHRVALLDILSLNLDRHSGNLLLTERVGGDGVAEPGLVAIDHGLTLPSLDGLEARAPHVMNNATHGNCLLRMPNSFAAMSADTVQRLELLDPERYGREVKATRDMLAAQHPGLDVEEKVPDANIGHVKRSAQLLKMAARMLSPAVIQIMIVAEWKDLFGCDDADFAANAGRLIDQYAQQADAIRDLYALFHAGVPLEAVCDVLKARGVVRYERTWGGQMDDFRAWMAQHAQEALEHYRAATRAGGV